ncbi:MAG: hypothetical protein CFE31_00230 [Rhizobiales bacterium PAR1]|nr:MAG: hypothetical protein CFE31_00230 [Rhizobiales bacterium PAR1]
MDRNGQVRKEPTLADLEAFEQLLRDSLHSGPEKTPAASPAPPATTASPGQSADDAAMAELARLIQTPVDFETPALRGTIPEPVPQPAPAPQVPEHHLHGAAEATLANEWASTPTVEASFSAPLVQAQPVSAPAAELDPLASFEEELRRFDAIRTQEQRPADQVAANLHTEAEQLHAQVQGMAQTQGLHAQPYAQENPYEHLTAYEPVTAPERAHAPAEGAPSEPEANWYAPPMADYPDPTRDFAQEQAAETSLNAAEERLAAEAAAAAAAADAAGKSRRSKGVFMALGGIAVAGIAVIGGTFAFGTSKKGGSGDVPTIAAKTAPTKEKPADPGGMEIPNQNKQVLAPRNTPETKPAAVVNSTEQPLDLNQVAKRDGVRVIAPSPMQNGGTSDPSAPGVEPRRVTSIRLGSEAPPAPPTVVSPTPAPVAPPLPPSGASARPSTPTPPAPVAQPQPRPVTPPVAAATPPTPPAAPKVESRPETPKATPPKVTTAPAAPAPKATPPKAAPRAPLSLDPVKQPPAAANADDDDAPAPAPTRTTSGGGGGYAIQLASRPTESDARTASGQLKAKFGSAIGGRSPSVVSGEANGQTVYRVRVNGYSQADAVAACAKVKAAGGGCFVTKQ